MARVKFIRAPEETALNYEVSDGQLIFAQDTGRIWLDAEAGRVEVAGGAVKSINGEKPDADGNVNISTDVEGVVKSINGETPDSDGNVALDIGTVKSVNGIEPDADGNVTISTGEGSGAEGTVKSVNGIEPDADGNVEVNVGVLTVNGVKPDSDGNIEIETNGEVSTSGLVKSVAGVDPDDAGNVDGDSLRSALGVVKSVNNTSPDNEGNVTLDVGTVKSVNGVTPDADGNVKITTDSSSGTSINHLVIQRPVSDLALYPYVEASESPDYNDSLEIDLYDDYDGNASYCKVFNGDSWMDVPKSGLGTPFDGMEVEIELSKFEGLSQPYYLRYGWVTSDGAYSNYKGLMFPSVSCAGGSSSSSSSTGVVKSVNGIAPDADGNVEITTIDMSLVRQTTVTENTINTLYLNKDIVIQSTVIGSELALDISSVLDANGKAYTGKDGDVLTWELWITASENITSYSLGGNATIMSLSSLPSTIPLVNDVNTRHIFTLRAVYDNEFWCNLKFMLNYCYSEEL